MALKSSNDTISITPIETGIITMFIVGRTPLYHHAMAEKARRTLLLGGGKKTSAEKAANVKHDPVEEYRASCYKIADDNAPTLIAMPAPAFKGVMRTAALDLPGTKRTEIGRLCWIEGYSIGIFGVPRLSMSVVRSADMARTPDIRTRAVMTEWCCEISVSYVKPKLNQTSVVNLIAAGGIVDGRGMAAAFALGAEGIQMGTRFVASLESPVHAHYKEAIVGAGTTGTWMLNTKSSPCIRALKTDFTQTIHEAGLMGPESFMGIQKVYFGGDMNAAPALAGQSAGLVHQVSSVQDIITQTVEQFQAISKRMGAMAQAVDFG